MPRPSFVGASLILLAIVTAAGCQGKHRPDAPGDKAPVETEITPEQARAALLRLDSLRVITGKDDDPIFVDMKSGAIAWTNDSSVTIGKFFSCDLKEKTWRMALHNGRTGKAAFAVGADGRFERRSDGTWLAVGIGGYIT